MNGIKATKKTPSGPPTLTPVPVRVDTPDRFAVVDTALRRERRSQDERAVKARLAKELKRVERERETTARIAAFLKELPKPPPPGAGDLSAKDVINRICLMMDIPTASFYGTGRAYNTVLARRLAVYIARVKLGLSYPELALAMDRPSHTSVLDMEVAMRRLLDDSARWHRPGQRTTAMSVLAAFGLGGEQTRTDSKTL